MQDKCRYGYCKEFGIFRTYSGHECSGCDTVGNLEQIEGLLSNTGNREEEKNIHSSKSDKSCYVVGIFHVVRPGTCDGPGVNITNCVNV